jgi:hypothetical protein
MTPYEELLAAALTTGFEPQRAREDDGMYLARLAVAVSAVPDDLWVTLTADATQWCIAAVENLNAGLPVNRALPGFNALLDIEMVTVEPIPDFISEHQKYLATSLAGNYVALVDKPVDPHCRISDDVEEVEPDEEDDAPKPPPVKTDLIRAVVIEHPDWEHPKIMAYLGAGANPNTVSTVRSITLATINIARSLGKWRDQ